MTRIPQSLKNLKLQELQLLEAKQKLVNGVPHKHRWPWYQWAWNFYTSRNSVNLLCAANQISKSSTQIRKCIEWATNKKLWPTLWKTQPRQFWYLYPTTSVATVEVEKKWMTEFLPAEEFKDHPELGWKVEYDSKKVYAIHFNSGVSVYFKTYAQDVMHLQSGTVHAIFCDEELPEELFDELMFRLAAVDGYFHMVFTATLNQEFWRKAIEPHDKDTEFLPDAFKQQISMYDCQVYMDGTPGPWSDEKIELAKKRCRSAAEVQRRVYGRFVSDAGRKYPTFDSDLHFIQPRVIDPSWKVYSGVDIGSGGPQGHPAAIVFVAVNPQHTGGYVIRGWRGDGVPTTSGDILEKYKELRGNLMPTMQLYDYAAKDFETIATRQGENFMKAEKSHEIGEDILNVLFKNNMLMIFDTDELRKLGGELVSLMKLTPKNKAKDDFADALRYAVTLIPWDWSIITAEGEAAAKKPLIEARALTEREQLALEISNRRKGIHSERGAGNEETAWEIQDDINYWNEQFE